MRARAILSVVALLVLAACTTTPTTNATPTVAAPTVATPTTGAGIPAAGTGSAGTGTGATGGYGSAERARDLAQLDDGEMRWRQAGIARYRIVVTERTAFRSQTTTLTVRDGQVVQQSATCQGSGPAPTPCAVQPSAAADDTVPGLFARARRSIGDPVTVVNALSLDATYGYPSLVRTSIPRATDAFLSVQIADFAVLP